VRTWADLATPAPPITAAPPTPASPPTPSGQPTPAPTAPGDSGELGVGAIVGIVGGVAVLLALLAVVVAYRRFGRDRDVVAVNGLGMRLAPQDEAMTLLSMSTRNPRDGQGPGKKKKKGSRRQAMDVGELYE